MIITKKILRNVSLTAHPVGCAVFVKEQLAWLEAQPKVGGPFPKRVLVIGGSTGYGLASRMVATILGKAATMNVSFEREPTATKTATPGWYNTHVFEKEAHKEGLFAKSVFGDAFSHAIKEETAALIAKELGQIDLLVYSLASPLRIDPVTGETYRSVLKPIGEDYKALSVDVSSGIIETVVIEKATDAQVQETVKVMGGEDWQLWIDFLHEKKLLADGVKTVAYSYIGPEVTYPVYREGTIGKAKEDLERTAGELNQTLSAVSGAAYVSVNKALVTRASAVIPVVPLYIALLYKVMKEKGLHEECTQQIYRLFTERLYKNNTVLVDHSGRIRLDDWEMRDDVQEEVERRWNLQKEGTALIEGDLAGFREEYDHIHGFGYPSVDYNADVDPREI